MSSEQNRKIINLLTVCIKAGKAVKGFDCAADAIKSGKAGCVITASDISDRSLKEISFLCGKYSVPLIRTGISKDELAVYTGKCTAVMAVCDKGFANGITAAAEFKAERE